MAVGGVRPVLHGLVTMSIKEMVSTETGQSVITPAWELSHYQGDGPQSLSLGQRFVISYLSVSVVGCLTANIESVLSPCVKYFKNSLYVRVRIIRVLVIL